MTHTPYPTGATAGYPTQPPAYPAYPNQGIAGPPSQSYSQPPPYPQYGAGGYQPSQPAYPVQPPPTQPPPTHSLPSQNSFQTDDNDAIIVESIRSAVSDAIQRRQRSIEAELNMEMQTLTQTEVELKAGRNRIQEIRQLLTNEQSSVGELSTKDIKMKF